MNSFVVLLSVLLLLAIAESCGVAACDLRFVRPEPYNRHIGWGGCDTCSLPVVANGSAMTIEWTGAHPNRSTNLRLFLLQPPSYELTGHNRLLTTVPAQTTNVTWIADVPQPVQDPFLFLLAVDQTGLNCSYSAAFYVEGFENPAAAKRSDSGKTLPLQNDTDGSRTSGVHSQYSCRRFCPSTSSTALLASSRWTLRGPKLIPLDPGSSSTAGPSFPATGTETGNNISLPPTPTYTPLPGDPYMTLMTTRPRTTTPSPLPPYRSSEASPSPPEAIPKPAQDTGLEPQPTSWPPTSCSFSGPRPSNSSSPVPVQPAPSAALSQGDKIRMGIEIPLIALFVVGVVWFLWRRHRKRSWDGRAPVSPLREGTGRPDPQPQSGRRLSGAHRRFSGISWLMIVPRGAWGSGEKDRRGNPLPPQELPADAAEVGRAM